MRMYYYYTLCCYVTIFNLKKFIQKYHELKSNHMKIEIHKSLNLTS
jgi:hypothetical protein